MTGAQLVNRCGELGTEVFMHGLDAHSNQGDQRRHGYHAGAEPCTAFHLRRSPVAEGIVLQVPYDNDDQHDRGEEQDVQCVLAAEGLPQRYPVR